MALRRPAGRVLCGALVLIQNRWIGEISRAEADRLRAELAKSLNRSSREFNNEITNACAALLPPPLEVEQHGAEKAYSVQYARWKESHDRLFSRIALVAPREELLDLLDARPRH